MTYRFENRENLKNQYLTDTKINEIEKNLHLTVHNYAKILTSPSLVAISMALSPA